MRRVLIICQFFLCWLLVFFKAGPPCGAQAADNSLEASSMATPVVSAVDIQIMDFPWDEGAWIEMARRLISVREGEPFSTDALEASIEALSRCNRFRKIDVSSEEEDMEMLLLFHLTPFRLVKNVKISGAYPLFESEVVKAMTLVPGDVYTEKRFQKQAELITALFRREGFIDPKVDVKATEDPTDGHYVLHVDISEGMCLQLDQLEITGNRAFSDTKLKLKMKVWRVSALPGSAGRFVEENLKNDIQNMTEYYWKKGYPEALIQFKVERHPDKGKANVYVKVEEGPRYEIEFAGNEAFGGRTLRKDLVAAKDGYRKDLGFRRSLRKIQERYRSAGYLETKVKLDELQGTPQDDAIRNLRFVIQEGPCTVVNSIQIAGNQAFDDEKIRKRMLTGLPGLMDKGVFIPERLDDDIDFIKSLYLKHGYMNTRIGKKIEWSDDKAGVTVILEIEEGIQTMVSSVTIHGLTAVSQEEAYEVMGLQDGKPFRRYMIQGDENALSALISKKGYPHVKVKGDVSISEDRLAAQVVYHVIEGPHAVLGRVYYRGNLRTREKILRRELGMTHGEPFSLKKMLQGQRNLRNTDLFKSVRVKAPGLKEKREELDLFVELEEKEPYFWELGGGYDSERGVFGHTRLGDHNLFGANKDGWVGGEMSQIGYRVESRIREPRLFGSKVQATLGIFTEKREEFNQAFGTRTHGASVGFYRRWLKRLVTGISFRYEDRDQFRRSRVAEEDLDDDDRDQYRPREMVVATPTIIYDSRDSFIRPREGTFAQFYLDLSQGISDDLDDFAKYRVDLRHYWTPFDRLTFAWLGRLGYIDPLNSDDRVPSDQLFFLGGTSSVRGFKENLLRFDSKGNGVGGRTAISGSMEARIDLGANLELTGFYDIGAVKNTIDKAGSDEFRDAVGLGLSYITPIGPVGLIYGHKLDRKEGERSGRVHFSIGYTF